MISSLLIKLPILTELKQELTKLYGNRLIYLVLFGSQARGDANYLSDIDVMIVLKSPIFPEQEIVRIADIGVTLELKYDQLLSIIPVSEEDYLQQQSLFMKNVRQEGILI